MTEGFDNNLSSNCDSYTIVINSPTSPDFFRQEITSFYLTFKKLKGSLLLNSFISEDFQVVPLPVYLVVPLLVSSVVFLVVPVPQLMTFSAIVLYRYIARVSLSLFRQTLNR